MSDEHSIETPEQTRLQFSIAGIGSRFLALAIDTLIQAAAAAILVMIGLVPVVSGVLKAIPFLSEALLWTIAVTIALLFALQFGYFAGFEILWSGQTPGKRVIGIRVIKETGRPLRPSETIARNLLRIVDQLPGFYGVGLVAAMLNSQNKRLGDFIAGSIVIREVSLREIRPVWQAPQAAPSYVRLGAERLTPDDLALIDAFLSRRVDLSPGIRAHMAHKILRRLADKLSLSAAQGLSAESLLELAAYERRSGADYR